MTLSYEGCPGERTEYEGKGQDRGAPAIDYDLLLCASPESPGETCAAVSDSIDDTNEGFDIHTQRAYEELVAYIVKRVDADGDGEWNDPEGCGGAAEPAAWATVWWK